MNDKYIFDAEGRPVHEPDVMVWAKFFETADRDVAKTDLPNGVHISTVFLGLDHSFGSGPPLLWETMIFGGEHDQYQERYASREAALIGHALAEELAKAGAQ